MPIITTVILCAVAFLSTQEISCQTPPLIPKPCVFAFTCGQSEDCVNRFCTSLGVSFHLTGRSCAFDRDCPSGYTCKRYSCWEEPANVHLEAQKCLHDGHCPQGYSCNKPQMTCMVGEPNGKHLQARVCLVDTECPASYSCVRNLCYDGAPVQHLEAVLCGQDYECPSSYSCRQGACYADGAVHGASLCYDNSNCSPGQFCVNLACRPASGPLGLQQLGQQPGAPPIDPQTGLPIGQLPPGVQINPQTGLPFGQQPGAPQQLGQPPLG